MAVYSYQSGKTYTDVDTVRVTVLSSEIGDITDYLRENDIPPLPDITGASGVLDVRFINAGTTAWENPAITG